jgi:hypothetical protein
VSTTPFQGVRAGATDVFVTKLDSSGSTVMYSHVPRRQRRRGRQRDRGGLGRQRLRDRHHELEQLPGGRRLPVVDARRQRRLRGEARSDGLHAGLLDLHRLQHGRRRQRHRGRRARQRYITGSTTSSTFPNNNAVICLGIKSTGVDAFVLRLNATGATVDYCRFIGGAGTDVGQGIAADAAGNVWVVGTTTSTAIGVVNALQPTLAGNTDAFVGKLDPLGAIVYLTYLGGAQDDEAFAVAVDGLGNAYVAGSTLSPNFPTVLPVQPTFGGRHDAFVSKLSPNGSALLFSTFLGGTGEDIANGIAVNATDFTVHVVGSTASVDFPSIQPFQGISGGRLDAFVTKLSAAGNTFHLLDLSRRRRRRRGPGRGGGRRRRGAPDRCHELDEFPGRRTPLATASGLLDAFVTQIADGGIIQFTATGFQIDETAANAVISVQRTGDTSATATVEFVTSDGTATAGADYTAVLTTLTFVPGQIVATVSVPILDDVIGDGDETVVLTLRNPTGGAVLGARKVVNLTILDNEPP